MLRTANQIRASQSFTFFVSSPPSLFASTLLPPTQWNLLPLLLMCLIIMCSTAVLSYHLRLLSSLIHVTVGGPTSSFVQGHIAGSFWTGLPPGGDPFVHHGVTLTEDKHELELSPSFLSLLFFLPRLPAHSFALVSFHFYPSICADLKLVSKNHHEPKLRLVVFGWYGAGELKMNSLDCPSVTSKRSSSCTWLWWRVWTNDGEKHGGPELIVQTQFLHLPLWNQELWMDITPLTSENQRGDRPPWTGSNSVALCERQTERGRETLDKGECVFM